MIKLVELTPLEPYFFGDERTFAYPGNDSKSSNNYYIRSLTAPTQTTLFGALRYLGNRKIESSSSFARDDEAIGKDSFRLNDTNQSFGFINAISGLFLRHGAEFYVPVPLDHLTGEAKYKPMQWAADCTEVADGSSIRKCFLPEDFDTKKGLAEGWLSLSTGNVLTDLFTPVLRVGIDKQQRDEAFFKREMQMLKSGYRFAFFTDVADDFTFNSNIVYLGQRKSAFCVKVTDGGSLLKGFNSKVSEVILSPDRSLPPGISFSYALSDLYLDQSGVSAADAPMQVLGDISQLRGASAFSITVVREHRGFTTDYSAATHKDRFKKERVLHHLLRAGSVFLVNNASNLNTLPDKSKARIAGFNYVNDFTAMSPEENL